jgi:hypothetical protein
MLPNVFVCVCVFFFCYFKVFNYRSVCDLKFKLLHTVPLKAELGNAV